MLELSSEKEEAAAVDVDEDPLLGQRCVVGQREQRLLSQTCTH